ncbi:MAG: hypothetical protein J6S14_15605 [Clostridia bacterium]|nr:hypothetical protein [Clostridia bacterium]
MKKIEKNVRVVKYEPETVYVAEDGTEFNSEEECLEYEKAIGFKSPQFTLNSCVLGDDLADWTWFYVRSHEELNAVQNLHLLDDYVDETYDPKPYPKWVCLALEDGGYGSVVGTLEDIEADVAAYVKTVREKQTGILNALIHQKYPEEQK